MTWYEDLAPLNYFGGHGVNVLKAVGWLDSAYPYRRGSVSGDDLEKLRSMAKDPWGVLMAMGFHECNICPCGDSRTFRYHGPSDKYGKANIFIPGDGFLFACPEMIVHYVETHEYSPPEEFIRALRECPPMKSPEYVDRTLRNGGQSFIDSCSKASE